MPSLLHASGSAIGETFKVLSTDSAAPNILHTISSGKTQRINIKGKNTDVSVNITFYWRIKDDTTTGEWEEYDFKQNNDGTNVDTYIMINDVIQDRIGNGDTVIECYASVTAKIFIKLEAVEV